MEYNEYLDKHSESIFHCSLPAKPGTKVIVNSVSTNYKDSEGVVEKYEISKYGVVVQIVFNDKKQFMIIRPVTDFGKTIFICEEDNKK